MREQFKGRKNSRKYGDYESFQIPVQGAAYVMQSLIVKLITVVHPEGESNYMYMYYRS